MVARQEDLATESYYIDNIDRYIIRCLQTGLPICSRPFKLIAERLKIEGLTSGFTLTEQQVIERIELLGSTDCIKRLGVIVRHHELGYRANAMVVWNIPDEEIAQVAQCISRHEFVTLCYQRPRHLPEWPYNLFSMIHGKDHEEVLLRVKEISAHCNSAYRHEILFSKRRFKQRGAQHQIKAHLKLQRDVKNENSSGANV